MADMNLSSNQGQIRYLTPLDISTKNRKKYCRFKRLGIKYIDYTLSKSSSAKGASMKTSSMRRWW